MKKSRFIKQIVLLFFTKQAAFYFLTVYLIVLIGFQNAIAQSKNKLEKLRAEFAIDEKIEDTDGVKIRKKLKNLLKNAEVRRFLATIKKAEHGEPNLMVGGCRAANLKKHPGETLPQSCWFPIMVNGKKRYSKAAGNYQITLENWRDIAEFLELKDFSEENQAIAALELIRRGGGAADARTEKGLALKSRIQNGFLALATGNLKQAFRMSTYDWASSKDSSLLVPKNYKKIDYWELSKK